MSRGRSLSPRSVDMDVDVRSPADKSDARVVIITNLTRNVVESHLKTIFGFYGLITKIDLPVFVKSGQNRGKAALEFADSSSAHKAASHMDGGQLDGSIVKVELSDLPIRSSERLVDLEMGVTDRDPSLAPAPVPALELLQDDEVQRTDIPLATHSVEDRMVVGVRQGVTFTDQAALAHVLVRPFDVVRQTDLHRPEGPFPHTIPLSFTLTLDVILKRLEVFSKPQPHQINQQRKEKPQPR
ncbi:hypothetical protein BYT27DRAFT_7108980 [Phlegmacium glaucopus]|nr:hypothetical protein BYT27DRAFT_7108980 [Phlegmacium glaucopus]